MTPSARRLAGCRKGPGDAPARELGGSRAERGGRGDVDQQGRRPHEAPPRPGAPSHRARRSWLFGSTGLAAGAWQFAGSTYGGETVNNDTLHRLVAGAAPITDGDVASFDLSVGERALIQEITAGPAFQTRAARPAAGR